MKIPNIDQAEQTALAARTQTESIGATLLQTVVTTDEQAQWAADRIHDVDEIRKGLITEKESVTKPLNAISRKISKWFKGPIERCDEILRHLKRQIGEHNERKRAAAAAALVESTSREETEAATAALSVRPIGVAERDEWSAEVVDYSQIPPEYWLLDLKRLHREARQQKERFAVPGVRAVCTKKVVKG